MIHGELRSYFKSTRGLRQGDSISPSLFIIMAEVLTRGLNLLFTKNHGLDYNYGGSILISHLAFADNIIIFTNGQQKSIKCISIYTSSSGQAININKSSFTTTKQQHQNKVAHITGFQFQPLPITYLRVPLFKGH